MRRKVQSDYRICLKEEKKTLDNSRQCDTKLLRLRECVAETVPRTTLLRPCHFLTLTTSYQVDNHRKGAERSC
jgi:hypothetical protein